ncbi:MAG: hypothetical protein HY717_24345 [Planctomycetes bacterium]|nr:hypothetical protein [Planctomycetota bacterium]
MKFSFFLMVSCSLMASAARAQSPRTIYTWSGTGNTRHWERQFGTNTVNLENVTDGELTITETGTDLDAGTGVAIGDGFNYVFEEYRNDGQGGLDLTGLSALEFDLGHDGAAPVDVQFYVNAATTSDFVALGPDQSVEPGVKTYTAPLGDLTPGQIAYVRTLGINIRDHLDQGNLIWTVREVRSAGTPLLFRDFVTFEPGASDNGLQGAFVNFEVGAVDGNDPSLNNGQNQTGLSQNLGAPPPGNTGSLQWKDLAGKGGAAVTWVNGTVYNGNSFWERPTDLSNYVNVVVRLAATNVDGGMVNAVGVQYFLQTNNYTNFAPAGPIQDLPVDGEYHELTFPLTAVPELDTVETHGINLMEHAGGDLIIDIDFVRAVVEGSITDCNKNRIPDERDLKDGTSQDCNKNGIPDECDLAAGTSQDCDASQVPDECEIKRAPLKRILYTWAGTGNPQGWIKHGVTGSNEVVFDNSTDGELAVIEEGADPGAFVLVSDGFNDIEEGGPSQGGLDLTGMESLEFDLGHNGTGPVNVQFFVQATPNFEYVALGPDVAVDPEIKTYTLSLNGLNAAQITYLRTIGLNFRAHADQGNLIYFIQEVRALGPGLSRRDYATHEPGSSDNGLQGAVVASDNAAVKDNVEIGADLGLNQTGLSQNTGPAPPGNTGSLRWTDLAGNNGGAVAWFNGTLFALPGQPGNTFNERPTDLSSFQKILVRMAATENGGNAEAVGVQYYIQSGNFQFHPAGAAQTLPADGQFHELEFSLDGIPDLRFVDAHGIDLEDHLGGDVIIDVDNLRAMASGENDCNANSILDVCDLASGFSKDENGNKVPDECELVRFRRGDVDSSGEVDISDPINELYALFLGTFTITCQDAADFDDSGEVDITDAINSLLFQFASGEPAPPPGIKNCGSDPTPDKEDVDLGCTSYSTPCP